MPRPTTALLSRPRILTAALELVDTTGTFTMPRLAARLSVSTSSLYHHVPGGREEVVEGLRGLLCEGAMPAGTEPGEGWREFAGRWARGYRAAMAAHPRVVPLLTAQTVSDPATLAGYEALARVLHADGFADEDLLHAVTVLDCLVLGSALDAGAPVDVWADAGDPASALSRAIAATRVQPGDRSQRSFEIGLEALLDGLARSRAPGRPARPARGGAGGRRVRTPGPP
ncbi:TetR/AcrR family transcriptional regulator C-terminal domain-containing protein [Kineococcus sp. SYSU DK004]|uniref:TetR/AcrR family transcriptional regulator C-terminal domain-containing protein n=1 Tax=Kineococcus sp. SYSU DK004 TaxID=3383125 RepID=UPI003D7DABAA